MIGFPLALFGELACTGTFMGMIVGREPSRRCYWFHMMGCHGIYQGTQRLQLSRINKQRILHSC